MLKLLGVVASRLVSAVASSALLVMLALPLEASAGSCTQGKRSIGFLMTWGDASAHTTFHNNTTDTTFRVQILRDGTVKTDKDVAPNDKAGHLANFGGTGKIRYVDFAVVSKTKGGESTATCAYRIKWDTDYLYWDLAEGAKSVCGDPTTLCPTCTISCDASFHKSKGRWNTSFKIAD